MRKPGSAGGGGGQQQGGRGAAAAGVRVARWPSQQRCRGALGMRPLVRMQRRPRP